MTIAIPATVAVLGAIIITRLLVPRHTTAAGPGRVSPAGRVVTGLSVRNVNLVFAHLCRHAKARLAGQTPAAGPGTPFPDAPISARQARPDTVAHIARDQAVSPGAMAREARSSGGLQASSGPGQRDAADLEGVLELLPFATLIVDETSRMVLVNGQARTLFGYGNDELIGAPASLLVPALGCNGGRVACRDIAAGSQAQTMRSVHEMAARRHDGTEFPVELVLNPLCFDGRPALLAVAVDRTERDELHRSRQELTHLSRVCALGELVGSLAHELNQPLTAILSNVQAAQRFLDVDPIDLREVREILSDIVHDNNRASEVIRCIRAFVRKDALALTRLELPELFHELALLIHGDSIARGIRVAFDVDDVLPPVCGDKVQLQQVMLNLLLNAFDSVHDCSGDDRVVTVRVTGLAGAVVRIAVRDRGHGIAADSLETIFTPFFTSKPQGLGLGLSISRTIVELHRGRLWAENNPDVGATFHLTLPSDAMEMDLGELAS